MIRSIKQSDVVQLNNILKKISLFTEKEVEVAMELIHIAANDPVQTDYNIYVYDHEGEILGYHCTGQRPLTDGVFDLYWIAADPDALVKGIGKELLKHSEALVEAKNGRWLLAETSSRDVYTGTRNFYMRNGFTIIANINDFYAVGDNLVVFGKYYNKN